MHNHKDEETHETHNTSVEEDLRNEMLMANKTETDDELNELI